MYHSNTLPRVPTFSNLNNPTMLGEELNKSNVLCFFLQMSHKIHVSPIPGCLRYIEDELLPSYVGIKYQ